MRTSSGNLSNDGVLEAGSVAATGGMTVTVVVGVGEACCDGCGAEETLRFGAMLEGEGIQTAPGSEYLSSKSNVVNERDEEGGAGETTL